MYNRDNNYYYRKIHIFFPFSYLLTKHFDVCTLIPSHFLRSYLPLPYYADGTNRSGGLTNEEAKKLRQEIYIQQAQAYSLQGEEKKGRKKRNGKKGRGVIDEDQHWQKYQGGFWQKGGDRGFGVCAYRITREWETDQMDMQT